jgi:adenylate cyclase
MTMIRPDSGSEGWEAELVMASGESKKHFELKRKEICRIGRNPDSTIQISTDNVSRNHAIVQASDHSPFVLLDLGSRNGTYVNGSRIAVSTPLRNGDVISIGGQELRFVQVVAHHDSARDIDLPAATVVERAVDEITVLVTDIRGYTKLCREIGEARVAEIMHTFNTEAGAALRKLSVWGVKYIGDTVMAIWVGPPEGFALAALRSTSALMDIADSLKDRFELASPILLGSAVNVGVASVGNMGGTSASDYTALGDVVNKVFRLEASAKELRGEVVISSEAYKVLRPKIDPGNSMIAKKVQLKGYSDFEFVYTLDVTTLRRILAVHGLWG